MVAAIAAVFRAPYAACGATSYEMLRVAVDDLIVCTNSESAGDN